MITQYIITADIRFGNEADRNTWYSKLRAAIINAKAASPAMTVCNIAKDERQTPDRTVEDLS